MKQFLEQLRALLGEKNGINFLVKFKGDQVTLITTIVREGKPDVPLKTEGTIDEIDQNYFAVLEKPAQIINGLKTNVDVVVDSLKKEQEADEKKAKTDAESAERKAKAAKEAGMTKEQKEAEKVKEIEKKQMEKVIAKAESSKDWMAATTNFKNGYWGMALTAAMKIAEKFPTFQKAKNMVATCQVKTHLKTPADVYINGVEEYKNDVPVVLPPNNDFDKESPIVAHADKIAAEEAEEVEEATDTPLAEELDENLSDVEEAVEPEEEFEEPTVEDDDNF